MVYRTQHGKINIKVLVILIVVVVGLGVSLVAARQIRRSILSKRDRAAGLAAYESQDWATASKHFVEYLGRRPEDVEIWKKCAAAKLAIRPFEIKNVRWTLGAYRHVFQMDPNDDEAFDELASLYAGSGNFGELAHIAKIRRQHVPSDRGVLLTYAEALMQLDELKKARQALETFSTGIDEPLERSYEEFMEAIGAVPVQQGDDSMRACLLVGRLAVKEDPNEPQVTYLKWLNKALGAASNPAVVLVRRAQFFHGMIAESDQAAQEGVLEVANGSGSDTSQEDVPKRLWELARRDLQAADASKTDDPRVLYDLGIEWMAHGDLDAAQAELEALDNLPQEKLAEHFLDLNYWEVQRFDFAYDLTARQAMTLDGEGRARKVLDGALLADRVKGLPDPGQRIRVLPKVIESYLDAAGVLRAQNQLEQAQRRIADANQCLDDYRTVLLLKGKTMEDVVESPAGLAWLAASVARVQGKPYDVINIVQPIVATNPSEVRLVRLLAEAYNQTGQTRRAIDSLEKCLDYLPQDADILDELATQYSKLGNLTKAWQYAEAAEAAQARPVQSADEVRLRNIRTELFEIRVELSAKLSQDANEAELETLSDRLTDLHENYPTIVEIPILQATIDAHLKNWEGAEKTLLAAIDECDEPLGARMQLVVCYQGAGQPSQAIATCEAACTHHPEMAEPWLSLATLHVANADPNAARGALKRGLKAVPEEKKRGLSIGLAQLERRQGNKRMCKDILQRLVREDENDVQARVLLLNDPSVGVDADANDLTTEELIAGLRRVEGQSGLQWRLYQASAWLGDANTVSNVELESKRQAITDLLEYCISADPGWVMPVLKLGNMYERLGDFQNAASVYEAGLVHNRMATAIADRLMAILIVEGRLSEAQSVLDKIAVNPEFVRFWQTRMLLQGGDVSQAIDRLERTLSDREPDAITLVQLGRLTYEKTGQIDQAFAYLDEAEAIAPELYLSAWERASIWQADGQTDKARQVLNDYVASQGSFVAYRMRADLLTLAGDLEQAERDYRKLTTFEKEGAEGYVQLSRFYALNERFGTEKERLDKAIAILEGQGLQAYPNDLKLERMLMETLLRRNEGQDRQRAVAILTKLEAARPQDIGLMMHRVDLMLQATEQTSQSLQAVRDKLEAIVRLNPRVVKAHILLIEIARREGAYERARDLVVRALRSNANDLDLLLKRSAVELDLGHIQTAQQLAEDGLEQDPNSLAAKEAVFLARLTQAHQFYQAGDFAAAKALYRGMLDEDPNNIKVLNDLAWILQEQDQSYEEALKLANRGLSASPDDVHLLDTRGTILMKMPDRLTDAKRDFERILELAPSDKNRQARTHAELARLCDKLEQKSQADEHAKKALEIDRDIHALKADQRKELARIQQPSS